MKRGNSGIDLLHDPKLNMTAAYAEAGRQVQGLTGLLTDDGDHTSFNKSTAYAGVVRLL